MKALKVIKNPKKMNKNLKRSFYLCQSKKKSHEKNEILHFCVVSGQLKISFLVFFWCTSV